METTIKFLSFRDVCGLTALSRASIYRLMETGEFPRPVKLVGEKSMRIAFLKTEVEGWMNRQITDRDEASAA